jgi:hypothetical protein
MTAGQIFSIANLLALGGWLIIIFLPRWFTADRFIMGVIITLLSFAYLALIIKTFNLKDFSGFSSLNGVMALFSDPWLLLAGWIHYLAFDLLTGLFISKNAAKQGIRHLYIIPSLLLTFILGPLGLLVYLIMRWMITKNYFEENF